MIPNAFITAWAARAPWPYPYQVEQDLILSRLMVEIANDELLKRELRLRGGTCLHKLHLARAWRYSEDLDYVRSTHSGIKPYVQALRRITAEVGFESVSVTQSGQMVHVVLDAEPTIQPGRIRVKIETNIAETAPHQPPITIRYRVDSPWWKGEAEIVTFELAELLGTKVRALYQRSRGRDLFDLWICLTTAAVDDEAVVAGFHHYMGDRAFSYPELARNLAAKLADPEFRNDMNELVAELPAGYLAEAAADLFMARIGSRLKNAPLLAEVESGRWRQ